MSLQCFICNDFYKNFNKCISLECSHIFHFKCLNNSLSCPICFNKSNNYNMFYICIDKIDISTKYIYKAFLQDAYNFILKMWNIIIDIIDSENFKSTDKFFHSLINNQQLEIKEQLYFLKNYCLYYKHNIITNIKEKPFIYNIYYYLKKFIINNIDSKTLIYNIDKSILQYEKEINCSSDK